MGERPDKEADGDVEINLEFAAWSVLVVINLIVAVVSLLP